MNNNMYSNYKAMKAYEDLFTVVLWLTAPSTASTCDVFDVLELVNEKVDTRGIVRVIKNIKTGSVYEVYRADNVLIGKGKPYACGGKTLVSSEGKEVLNSRTSAKGFRFYLDIVGTSEIRKLWSPKTPLIAQNKRPQ